MNTVNDTVVLIGRSGNEPFVKHFGENKMMARFSFAEKKEKLDENGEAVLTTQWHKIVAWGRVAALVEQKVRKGCKLTIVGKLQSKMYPDADGQMKEANEILLYNLSVYHPENQIEKHV